MQTLLLARIRIGSFRSAGIFLITILFFLTTANAQTAGTGSIQGTIADPTGAVVQNGEVTLTDTATGVQHKTASGADGLYSLPNIPIGIYNLDIVAPGFQHYTQAHIVLEVGSSISINVSLSVGAPDQRVEVKSEGLALQTEDSSFKQTIDQQTVTEMPLNGRQMTALITLSGGSTSAPAGDFTGSKYSYQTISVSIAGGMGNTTMWRLDGGDNNDYMANGNLPFPFPDAVGQFSVESTALSAGNGQHTGGLVNVVTRSGTNSFHGSGFEFLRNNYINATNFFSTSKDTLHQNQFGGTFGGPILKDKLFAFAGYQRSQAKQSQAATQAHVPTAANLTGDFSVTDGPNCTSNGKFLQLMDPLTGAKLDNDKYPSQPAYNEQSLNLMKYLPTIDPAVDTQNCGLVSYAIPSQTSDNQFVTRADYNISANNNLYGRYFVDGYQAPAFFSPTNILITTQSGNSQRVQSLTMGWAYTINARVVNTAHATWLRRRNNRGYADNDINAATLGVDLYQAVPNGLQLAATNKFTIGSSGCWRFRTTPSACRRCCLSISISSSRSTIRWVIPAATNLLCAVAERLRGMLRPEDFVARFGGDEFVVFQQNIESPEDAAGLARRIVDRLSERYKIDNHLVEIGASVGIALTSPPASAPIRC